MSYLYDGLWAIDPSNPLNAATNGTLTIFDPNDPSHTPLEITDPDGQPLANPVITNDKGFVPPFRAGLDRVGWIADDLTGYQISYDGIKSAADAAAFSANEASQKAEASQSAASAAQLAAEEAALLVGAPADTAVAGLVGSTATETGLLVNRIATTAADLARSSTAVISTGVYQGANYKLIRVVGAAGKPGLIGKRFGQDYTSGTPGDGFTPPTETLTSVFKRTGADIVLNGGGWVVEPGNPRDGFMDGCQILDGVLYRDFNPSGNRGRDALGIHYDGSIGLYSAADGHTGQQMVDAGVQHSFSFGPALVKAGVSQAVDATTISARQVLAVTSSGDLLIITVTGQTGVAGLSYKATADLAVSLGALFAVPMDGGGSAQTLVQGNWINPSSDPTTQRATIDFLTIHAKIVGDTASTWHPLTPENGFTSAQAAVRQHNGQIEFRGSLTNGTATGTVQASSLPWWARPETHQRIPATINLTAGQFYDFEVGGALKMNTTVTNGGPRYISFVNYPAKPI